MNPGKAPDARNSAFFRYHTASCEAELDCHWAEASDLMIPDWHHLTFLVSARVPAGVAHHFGDGRSPFPGEAQDLGLDRDTTSYQICDSPVDQQRGKVAHRRLTVAQDFLVPATWSMTLSELLGQKFYGAFQSLCRLEDFDQLRIIMYRA